LLAASSSRRQNDARDEATASNLASLALSDFTELFF